MAHSSILGVDRAPPIPRGHEVGALGPSDSSDSGSDVQGQVDVEETRHNLADLRASHVVADDGLHHDLTSSDTDAEATGERASIIASEDLRDAGDIAPDRIINSLDEIGLEEELRAVDEDEARTDEDAELDGEPGERDPSIKARGTEPRAPLDCAEWLSTDDE
jgi:hypothetical protein